MIDKTIGILQEEFPDHQDPKYPPPYIYSKRGPEMVTFYGVYDPLGSKKFIYVGVTANPAWNAVYSLFVSKNSSCQPLYIWWEESKKFYPGGLYIPKAVMVDYYYAERNKTELPRINPTPDGKVFISWKILRQEMDERGTGQARELKPELIRILKTHDLIIDPEEWIPWIESKRKDRE